VRPGEKDRLGELEKRVDDLERFRSWLTGLFVAVGVIGAFLAEKLKKLLGVA
jgi:hypothetical protein